MQIQNPALANVPLRMRSGRTVKGDHEGVFDVTDEEALFLLGTPGWSGVSAKNLERAQIAVEEAKRALEAAEKHHARMLEVTQREEAAPVRRVAAQGARAFDPAFAATLPPGSVLDGPPEAAEVKPPTIGSIPPPPLAPVLPELALAEDESTGELAEDEEVEDEEIDLEALNKDQLLDLAAKYKAKVDKRWGEEKLREELAKQIFEEKEE